MVGNHWPGQPHTGWLAPVIRYGCCVGSWDRFRQNVAPGTVDRQVMALSGQTSIAAAYNAILNVYMSRKSDAVILLHDDLEITDPEAEAKFLAALERPGVALVGVAGGDARGGLAWWNHDPIGHQLTDSMNIDFGIREGPVDLLEGSILVFNQWAVQNIRFDVRLHGFHGYDEIAMQVKAAGGASWVTDVDTHHHTQVGFKSRDSQEEWHAADKFFREKWKVS